MAKLAVQVTSGGDLDYSGTSRAFESIRESASSGDSSAKDRAAEIAEDWDAMAERCEEVGHLTEYIRGTTVILTETDCRDNASLWRQLTEHAIWKDERSPP